MTAIEQFQQTVWDYYHDHGRTMPWREDTRPYYVLVSELMLQQTQVSRVVPKFESFIAAFPDEQTLAGAELAAVLRAWQGLGYNRRAKFLHQAAQHVVSQGSFPNTVERLVELPGVGKNTAGAIMAYSYNHPIVFIETNIRTVYIHHFFTDRDDVADAELLPIIEQSLDQEHPREWYWALMDYGSYLKTTIGNVSRSSRHYAKQSTFHGSKRQIRGQVLKLLAEVSQTENQLRTTIDDQRLGSVLQDLTNEGLIRYKNNSYYL